MVNEGGGSGRLVPVVVAAVAAAVLAAGGTWLAMRTATPPAPASQAGALATAPAVVKEIWQCPMHPTITQDHPGECPICGMKLVKVSSVGPGASTAAPSPAGSTSAPAPAPVAERWQCPMHPSVVQDHPGDCPICGMKLVKQASSTVTVPGPAGPVKGLAPVTIDPARQQLIGLEVAHVERAVVGGAWRTTGRVAIDETRIHHVNVKFSGFIEHVHGDFVGRTVTKGEPLFSIYSPELLAAQEEYLLALRTRSQLGGEVSADGDTLAKAARRKLELWDVPAEEIDRLERTREPSRTVMFRTPASGVITKKDVVPGMRVQAGEMPFEITDLSRVWFLADAYETDLRHVRPGLGATLTLRAIPGKRFRGRVAFVDPVLDPRTRTAKVRVEFANPSGELRPEMFGEVVIEGPRRDGLRIPADAVIRSGTVDVVFVALGDGRFQPREVQLGEADPQWAEVTGGLEAGEGVVVRANFLVDSESRLRASLAALAGGSER